MPRWLALTLTHPVSLALLAWWLLARLWQEKWIREAAGWTWAGVCVVGQVLELLAEAVEEALGRLLRRVCGR
jgi:hypothetical protein